MKLVLPSQVSVAACNAAGHHSRLIGCPCSLGMPQLRCLKLDVSGLAHPLHVEREDLTVGYVGAKLMASTHQCHPS